ncbi:MAG: hypothetical protein E6K53_04380 [Gammaproteobacteria bacterium]|nr:MAG: hypothetical protein E6K53_04380 [Gammaproteobacteria bacterium]
MKELFLPIVAAVISAFGQVLLKYAMLRNGPIQPSLAGVISLITQPRLILALVVYAIALLMWLQVLSKFPLGIAYSILALTYVAVPVLAFFFFGERLVFLQFVGMAFVLIGVALLGYNYGHH